MKNIILFGSGYMANEYLKVLKVLDCRVTVVGRDESKAKNLASQYGYRGCGGGVSALKNVDIRSVDWVINAASIDSLDEINKACLKAGIGNILVEKPGALTLQELKEISSLEGNSGKIRVALNRRFYNSVQQLQRKMRDDGGALGCFFDFTDREKDVLRDWKKEVAQRWGWCNSMHVIDTAFYLIGHPEELTALRSGSFDSHPSGSIFVGCGKTRQCLFSCFATWSGGGRWNIEISTQEGRYKLSPLESLAFCRKNQFSWENIPFDDQDDEMFKPGLYKMIKTVVCAGDSSRLPTISEQIERRKLANRIFGYED